MSKKVYKPFKLPYDNPLSPGKQGTDKLHLCKECVNKVQEMDKRLYTLEGRVKELEATFLEIIEEGEKMKDEESLGTEDSLENSLDFSKTTIFSRKNAQTGKFEIEEN